MIAITVFTVYHCSFNRLGGHDVFWLYGRLGRAAEREWTERNDTDWRKPCRKFLATPLGGVDDKYTCISVKSTLCVGRIWPHLTHYHSNHNSPHPKLYLDRFSRSAALTVVTTPLQTQSKRLQISCYKQLYYTGLNKYVFSFLRQLVTCHCPHLLRRGCCWAPAVQQSMDIACSPGPQQQTRSSGVRRAGEWDRQTDGKTPYRYTAPCSAKLGCCDHTFTDTGRPR